MTARHSSALALEGTNAPPTASRSVAIPTGFDSTGTPFGAPSGPTS